MKQRLLWLWLLPVALLLSNVSTARSQHISVEGTYISLSESNPNVLEGKGEGRDGCVSYDAETKTLTLNNAILKSREQSSRLTIMGTKSDTVTVRLVGENSMLAFATNTVSITDSNVRLTGSGSLSVSNGNNDRLITFSVSGPAASLLIDSTTLIVDGSFQNAQCDATLVINHSNVKASQTVFKQITLNDCYLSEPEGAFISTVTDQVGSYQAIVDNTGRDAQNYTILPGTVTTYPIVVAGTGISSKNQENVLAGQGVGRDGAVRYDAETKTLTLENANLTTKEDIVMLSINEFGPDTLTINLVGKNHIESNSNAFAFLNSTVRITGSGSLESVSTASDHMGIAPLGEGANLIISNTTVTAKGGAGIYDPNLGATLTIENSKVTVEGGVVAKTITLKDCFVELPTGGRVGEGSAKDGTKLMGVWEASNDLALFCVILPESHRSIAPVESSEVTIQFHSVTKELQVSGLTADERAYLFDMTGVAVAELVADAEGTATQSLAQLPAGNYLVVTTKGAYKLTVAQ